MNKFRKIAIVMAATAMLGACTNIDEGTVGVTRTNGEITDVSGAGMNWYFPLTQGVEVVELREVPWKSKTEAYTKDVQQADIQFTLNYKLRDQKVVRKVLTTIGSDWANNILPAMTEKTIKEVFGRSEAVAGVINKRGSIEAEIERILNQRLASRGIVVTAFALNDVSFSAEFEKANEAKQVAVELANAERNRTVQVQEKGKQVEIAARADAEAMRIKTEALSGNAKLVEYEAVQAWRETGGKVPSYVVMGNGSGPIPFLPIAQK